MLCKLRFLFELIVIGYSWEEWVYTLVSKLQDLHISTTAAITPSCPSSVYGIRNVKMYSLHTLLLDLPNPSSVVGIEAAALPSIQRMMSWAASDPSDRSGALCCSDSLKLLPWTMGESEASVLARYFITTCLRGHRSSINRTTIHCEAIDRCQR